MKIFVILFSFILLFSCKNKNTHISNVLVESNLYCAYIVDTGNLNNQAFKNNFNLSLFYAELLKKIKDIDLYNSCYPDTTFKKIDIDNKNTLITNIISKKNFYNGIYFYENWYLDTMQQLTFEKNVIFWSPVFYYDSAKVMKIPFKIKNSNRKLNAYLKYIVKYEINLNDSILLMNSNLNFAKLKRVLTEIASSNNHKVYHPFSLKVLNKQEIKEKLEINVQTDFLFVPITSLLFEEEWHIDTVNFSILKKVISVAPIKYEYDEENELNKKILYVLFFEEKPHKII